VPPNSGPSSGATQGQGSLQSLRQGSSPADTLQPALHRSFLPHRELLGMAQQIWSPNYLLQKSPGLWARSKLLAKTMTTTTWTCRCFPQGSWPGFVPQAVTAPARHQGKVWPEGAAGPQGDPVPRDCQAGRAAASAAPGPCWGGKVESQHLRPGFTHAAGDSRPHRQSRSPAGSSARHTHRQHALPEESRLCEPSSLAKQQHF